MPRFKNIRIKKPGGGTRMQRVKVLKSGKFKFVKNLKNKIKRTKKRGNPHNKKRRNNPVARRKNRKNNSKRNNKGKFSISSIACGATALMGSADGWGSPLSMAQQGKPAEAFQSFIRNMTGIKIGGIGGQGQTEFDVFRALNPLDMGEAPAWKAYFWAKIGTKVIRKFAGNPFSGLPFVKDFLRFG